MIRRLLVVVGLVAGLAVAQDLDYMFTGQAWHDAGSGQSPWDQGMKLGYVLGHYHGMQTVWSAAGLAKDTIPPIAKCLDRMRLAQRIAIMDKYVADHPEKWHEHVGELYFAAIVQACQATTK